MLALLFGKPEILSGESRIVPVRGDPRNRAQDDQRRSVHPQSAGAAYGPVGAGRAFRLGCPGDRGHRNVQTTASYIHLAWDSVKVATEKVSGSLGADLDSPTRSIAIED